MNTTINQFLILLIPFFSFLSYLASLFLLLVIRLLCPLLQSSHRPAPFPASSRPELSPSILSSSLSQRLQQDQLLDQLPLPAATDPPFFLFPFFFFFSLSLNLAPFFCVLTAQFSPIMSGEAWLYLLSVLINAVNLFLQVFFTIMYSDLEW